MKHIDSTCLFMKYLSMFLSAPKQNPTLKNKTNAVSHFRFYVEYKNDEEMVFGNKSRNLNQLPCIQ